MIPKVINYCWFGRGEKSKEVEQCINSWKKNCPDYIIKEWNEDNFDINCNDYVKEAYEQKKWAFVSDYARLWIIYNNGGFYLDTDVELIKPLDGILNCDAYFGFESESLINTGLGFGAIKKSDIVKMMLDDYEDIHFIDEKGNIDYTTCVIRNTNSINNKYIDKITNENEVNVINNVYFFPKDYFCPYDYNTGDLNITDNTISIHWCNASWQSKRLKTYSKIKKIIKKILGNKIYSKLKKFKSRGK